MFPILSFEVQVKNNRVGGGCERGYQVGKRLAPGKALGVGETKEHTINREMHTGDDE